MPLVLLIVAVLILGLGVVQAWTIWFLKREVQRLEFRLSEALDDEDLLEFQERLRALLNQAKETAAGLAQSVDQRRETLEKSLEKAKQAEKSLALRILSKSAVETAKASLKPAPKPAAQTTQNAQTKPKDRNGAKTAPKATAKTPAKTVRPGLSSAAARPTIGPKKAPEFQAPSALSENRRLLDEEEDPPRIALAEKRADANVFPRTPALSRYQKIYDLADQGLDLEQISKQSGVLAGEVDLILNLRRKEPPRA